MPAQFVHLRRRIPPGQQAAVYERMQRLDPAVQYLRKPGNVGHLANRDASVGQAAVRAAGADEFVAGIAQALAQVLNAALVEYAE